MSPFFDLTGHVSVITGGTAGIGLAMARGLHAAGACVMICGRSRQRCDAALESFDNRDRIAAIVCDVSNEEDVDRLIAASVDRFGRLDSCFANAGISGADVAFTELDQDEWWSVLKTNLGGAFLTTRAAGRHMVDHGGGTLVVTSSTAAVYGRPRGEAYAASKGASDSMVRGIAVELARYNVRANLLVPGFFDTDIHRGALELPKVKSKILTRIPLRRWGTDEDIAGVAVFLASSHARYITGQTITVDGGYAVY
jgi:NAD(P)-dependent dehydrogenase (short-subunit alcohol dehydrogenase family)